LQSVFPAAIASFEAVPFKQSCIMKIKVVSSNGAIAARWQAKAGVEPPFAGCERPFSLREVLS